MRTLVDINDSDVTALDELAARAKRSRAALIREAISQFLGKAEADVPDAFGLWGKRAVDGLVYQQKVRDEW